MISSFFFFSLSAPHARMSAHPWNFTPSQLRAHGRLDGRLRYHRNKFTQLIKFIITKKIFCICTQSTLEILISLHRTLLFLTMQNIMSICFQANHKSWLQSSLSFFDFNAQYFNEFNTKFKLFHLNND